MPPYVKTLLHITRLASIVSLLVVGSDALYARSEANQPPEYCTVFHHMVKSGGSTIKSTLRSASRGEGVPLPGLCVDGPNSIPTCKKAFNSSAVIMGYAELMRTPLEAVRNNCEYFTLLRHPIDRLVSAFFYCPLDHDRQLRPLKFCGNADHPVPATERLLEFAQIYWQSMTFKQMTFGIYCFPDLICQPTRVFFGRRAKGFQENISYLAILQGNRNGAIDTAIRTLLPRPNRSKVRNRAAPVEERVI